MTLASHGFPLAKPSFLVAIRPWCVLITMQDLTTRDQICDVWLYARWYGDHVKLIMYIFSIVPFWQL